MLRDSSIGLAEARPASLAARLGKTRRIPGREQRRGGVGLCRRRRACWRGGPGRRFRRRRPARLIPVPATGMGPHGGSFRRARLGQRGPRSDSEGPTRNGLGQPVSDSDGPTQAKRRGGVGLCGRRRAGWRGGPGRRFRRGSLPSRRRDGPHAQGPAHALKRAHKRRRRGRRHIGLSPHGRGTLVFNRFSCPHLFMARRPVRLSCPPRRAPAPREPEPARTHKRRRTQRAHAS